MRMYDIIEKKRDGGALSDAEIGFFVDGYTSGRIPDYQASALLMAIYLRGMTPEETRLLTMHMMNSGDVMDLSSIPGGTVDKLESIPGFDTALTDDAFLSCVLKHGASIIGQTGNLVPADKLIYALRDVTATVSCIPLIASSIMSKKLAAGSGCILLDVKVGSGAFMKTVPEAIELAQAMVEIGEGMGRRVKALITNMDRPLGRNIGNALEVVEVIETLQGQGPADLTHEAIMLASDLLELTGRFDHNEAEARARRVIEDGSALAKLKEIVAAQGGDVRVIDNPSLLPQASLHKTLCAPCTGFVAHIDTERVGVASAELGGGRLTLDDEIDHSCGITLLKNYGDPVEDGEPVAIVHANDAGKLACGLATLAGAYTYGPQEPPVEPLLYASVTAAGVAYA